MLDKLIVLNNDNIIKVINEDNDYHYGYDLITEEFKQCFKNKSVVVSRTLIKLLGCQNTRTKIAINLTTNEVQTTKMLQISPRTLNRIKAKLKKIK